MLWQLAYTELWITETLCRLRRRHLYQPWRITSGATAASDAWIERRASGSRKPPAGPWSADRERRDLRAALICCAAGGIAFVAFVGLQGVPRIGRVLPDDAGQGAAPGRRDRHGGGAAMLAGLLPPAPLAGRSAGRRRW